MIFSVLKKLFFSLAFFSCCFSKDSYEFKGKHFIASYSGCDLKALTDLETLVFSMEEAVKKSGATILDSSSYIFPGNGITMTFLLSESHASIHTYPEHESCFIDLFTCGDMCNHEAFHASLSSYLKPSHVNQKVLIRHKDIDDL